MHWAHCFHLNFFKKECVWAVNVASKSRAERDRDVLVGLAIHFPFIFETGDESEAMEAPHCIQSAKLLAAKSLWFGPEAAQC